MSSKKATKKKVETQSKKRPPHKPLTGIAVGKNKGFKVTRRLLPRQPSTYKGFINRRKAIVRSVISEVVGFSPYEKRLIDLMKNNLDKRALRLAKKKLGSHRRAKAKREAMGKVAFRLRQEAARKRQDDEKDEKKEEKKKVDKKGPKGKKKATDKKPAKKEKKEKKGKDDKKGKEEKKEDKTEKK